MNMAMKKTDYDLLEFFGLELGDQVNIITRWDNDDIRDVSIYRVEVIPYKDRQVVALHEWDGDFLQVFWPLYRLIGMEYDVYKKGDKLNRVNKTPEEIEEERKIVKEIREEFFKEDSND